MGRFLLGFMIGAAIGATLAIIMSPRSGRATRSGIRNLIDETLEVARAASTQREREMWSQFRRRRANKDD